ncbi:MAG: AsmA family protein, partial [Lentisphaeria bacterium]|nr:AsmA family protein [Lentisphaeria bacterium]NQZ71056.1 AsmA family protein [Lentisphaeria bacterium]
MSTNDKKKSKLSLILKISVVIIILIIGIVVVMFMNLNSIIKKTVESIGPDITKTDVKLDRSIISVFSGKGELHGILIGNPEGYNSSHAIKIEKIAIELEPASLKSDKIHIKTIVIDSP